MRDLRSANLNAVAEEQLGTNMIAPTFSIVVDGAELATDITQFVLDVEYEHTSDIASMMIIAIENRGGRFSGAAVFEPGREIDLYMGYANENSFIGRAEIVRHLPRFPADEFPVLEIRGYDRSWRMGNTDVMSDDAMVGPAARRPKHPAPTNPVEGVRFYSGTVGSVVVDVCKRHGIMADVDKRFFDIAIDKIQPKEMSDIDFIRALASVFDGRFYVEYGKLVPTSSIAPLMRRGILTPADARRIQMRWIGHFWPLERTQEATQEVKLEYAYDDGDNSSIINIELDWGLPTTVTEMQVWIWSDAGELWELVVMDPPPELPPKLDPKKKRRSKRNMRMPKPEAWEVYNTPDQAFIEQSDALLEMDDSVGIKLGLAGHSVRVKAPPLNTVEEALAYAKAWYHANRNNFIFARGRVIGEPTLRAGQIHTFTGIGDGMSGDYELTSVRHRFSVDEGYLCTFTANKVLPNVPLEGRVVPAGELQGG